MSPLEPPLPPLEVIGELGRGAVATVYEIEDRGGRRFAAKVLHPSHALDRDAGGRFAREVGLLEALHHDNVVKVIGSGEVGGVPALIMELVRGESLAHRLARIGTLPEPEIVAVVRDVAAGLGHAHAHGIVHRDLKPANVLLDAGGRAKIADFGLSRAGSYAGVERDTFAVVGTPDYMAPESVDPLVVDGRTDLYALGCMLHEAMTGRPPYGGPSPIAILHAHRSEPLPNPSSAHAPWLWDLCLRLLAKSPAERLQSAQGVLQQLDAGPGGVGGALALRASGPRCSGCGAALLPVLSSCLRCGTRRIGLEPGDHGVVVTGPGALGDKLDSRVRNRLVEALERMPEAGWELARLRKSLPRVPFVLVRGLSEASATGLAGVLASTGATLLPCDRAHEPAELRRKARVLGQRATGVAFGMMAGVWNSLAQLGHGLGILAAFVIVPAGAFAATYVGARRSLVRARPRIQAALPGPLRASLDRIEAAVAAIPGPRQRETLSAIVDRVVALHQAVPEAPEAELAHALDVALVSSARLDALEGALAGADLRALAPEVRERLHERDTWSARQLELIATLDGLQARAWRADARGKERHGEADLAEIALRVEALEELEALDPRGS